MPKGHNYMLQEASTERVPEEGITHTTDPAARLWPVEVHFSTGLRPSRETVRATSAAQALEFIAARYRFADMERTRVLEDAPVQVAPPIVQTVNAVEVRRLAELLFDELPRDGSTMNDDEARDALSAALDRFVPDSQFQQVKQHLVSSGQAKRCRGRGGPLARVLDQERERITAKAVAMANESIDRLLAVTPASVVPAAPPAAPIAPTPPPPVPASPLDPAPAPLDPREAPLDPPAPAPKPTPPASTVQVVPGEKDALGRTMVSPENARAAAILHATGQATWEDLARAIGCNRDNLRRKAARHKPQLQAAELIPPAPTPVAAGPFIGFLPSVGWAVVISSTADAMTAAGFTAVTTLQQASAGR